jgi:hypothetical protein
MAVSALRPLQRRRADCIFSRHDSGRISMGTLYRAAAAACIFPLLGDFRKGTGVFRASFEIYFEKIRQISKIPLCKCQKMGYNKLS